MSLFDVLIKEERHRGRFGIAIAALEEQVKSTDKLRGAVMLVTQRGAERDGKLREIEAVEEQILEAICILTVAQAQAEATP